MVQVDQAALILDLRDALRAKVSLLETQMAAARVDAERWKAEYLLLSAWCQPDGLGKRPSPDPDADGNGSGGLASYFLTHHFGLLVLACPLFILVSLFTPACLDCIKTVCSAG